jgi:nucleoside-diphosphate-sugar epimerase
LLRAFIILGYFSSVNTNGLRVFVAGATGVVGWRAVRELVAAGAQVTGVARSAEKAEQLRVLGATPVEVDLFDEEAVRRAVPGHQVVMNLATHIPPVSRASLPGAWKENDRIRTEVSANLAGATMAAGAERYVQESISFTYADGGDAWLTEDAALDVPASLRSVLAAEAAAQRVTDAGAIGVVLRFAQFYGTGATHTDTQLAAARRGVAPVFGRRESYLSVIHLDDAGRAAVAALDLPAGPTNVGDDEPMRREDHAAAIAAALGRPRLRWAGAAGRAAGRRMQPLLRSQRLSNRRLRETGWAPVYPSAREGWVEIVNAGAGV